MLAAVHTAPKETKKETQKDKKDKKGKGFSKRKNISNTNPNKKRKDKLYSAQNKMLLPTISHPPFMMGTPPMTNGGNIFLYGTTSNMGQQHQPVPPSIPAPPLQPPLPPPHTFNSNLSGPTGWFKANGEPFQVPKHSGLPRRKRENQQHGKKKK